MQSVIRERIIVSLLRIPPLVDHYSQQNNAFPELTMRWLSDTEHSLQPFRLPLVSRLASLRGMIIAGGDGLSLSAGQVSAGRNPRKLRRSTTMNLLQQAEETLHNHCQKIDQELDDYRDKLAQILAVASAREALPGGDFNSVHYIDQLWKTACSAQENTTMAQYVSARLSETDRRYLMVDIVRQLMTSRKDGD